MIQIQIATRKYAKETYTFFLHLPEYEGETGILNVEIEPYLTVQCPENGLGYTDTFFYNSQKKDGYFAYRHHSEWIKQKIIQSCNRMFEPALDKYYYNTFTENEDKHEKNGIQ